MSAHEPSNRDAHEQALDWFARLRARPEAAESEAFARWYAQPAHAEAFDRVAAFWQGPRFAQAAARAERRVRRKRRARQLSAAAVVVLAAASTLLWQPWHDWNADYVTAAERRTITLADGSSMTLNGNSAVTVALTGRARMVRVLRGAAYFEVRRDAGRPFVAAAAETRARVLGTDFAVRRGAKRTHVSVVHGRVAVKHADEPLGALPGGQTMTVSAGGHTQRRPLDPAFDLAWRRGRFTFRDQRLDRVLRRLDHYLPGALVLLNATLAKRRVTGNFSLDDPAAIAAELARTVGAGHVHIPGWLTILR